MPEIVRDPHGFRHGEFVSGPVFWRVSDDGTCVIPCSRHGAPLWAPRPLALPTRARVTLWHRLLQSVPEATITR